MRAVVVKRDSFDAAHFLPGYPGKCANLHGHHWVVEVGIVGEVNKETGMVIDFSKIKKVMEPIIDRFDHHCLNDSIKMPTAENIATYILTKLGYEWIQSPQEPLQVKFVRVWESEDSYAEVSNA